MGEILYLLIWWLQVCGAGEWDAGVQSGDEKEEKEFHEELIESGEADSETLMPPRDPTTPRTMPSAIAGSAPVNMRQTPSSFKVGTLPKLDIHPVQLPDQDVVLKLTTISHEF